MHITLLHGKIYTHYKCWGSFTQSSWDRSFGCDLCRKTDHILYTYAVLPKLSFRDLGLLLRPDMFCNASSFQSWMVAIQLWSPKDSWWLIVYTSVNRWNACVNAAVVGESVTFLSPSWTQMTLIGALVCFGYSFSIVLMHWHMQQQVYMKKQLSSTLKILVWQCVSPLSSPISLPPLVK